MTKLFKPQGNGPVMAVVDGVQLLCTFESIRIRTFFEGEFWKQVPPDIEGTPWAILPSDYFIQVMNKDNERDLVAKICAVQREPEPVETISGKFSLEDLYGHCLYQVQYVDSPNSWTAPVTLLKKRAEKFLNDHSVIKVRLIFDRTTLELNIL